MKRVLTIAGSDSGGGAGIQADLKTFSAFGVFGTSAITALTAQNTLEVKSIHPAPPSIVEDQIDAVLADIGTDAVKTGMLFSKEIIESVARALKRHAPPHIVLDPVMVSKSGAELLEPDARAALARELIPLCEVMTPNVPEAEVLLGASVKDLEDLKEAARALREMGCGCVVLKGGHLAGDPVDILYDGKNFEEVRGARIDTPHTHGTGCTLSAALAACLALGASPLKALIMAKAYVTHAIRSAPGLGRGAGPLNHMLEPKTGGP